MCELSNYLQRDHDDQRALMAELATPCSTASRSEILARLRINLLGHGQAEIRIFYPVFSLIKCGNLRLTLAQARLDHERMEFALERLHVIHPAQPQWEEGIAELTAMVLEHLREEEYSLFDHDEPSLPYANRLAMMSSMDQIKTAYAASA